MSGFNESDFDRVNRLIEKNKNLSKSGGFGSLNSSDCFSSSVSSPNSVSSDLSLRKDFVYDRVVSGTIFLGENPDIISGNIYIENGIIVDIEERPVKSDNWIAPRFVNTHTHIGDSLLKDPPLGNEHGFCIEKDLDALVKPPNGLKHKFLSQIGFDESVDAMESAVWELFLNGVGVFADFREGGLEGTVALLKAVSNTGKDIFPFVFGRPGHVYGIGSNDHPNMDFLEEVRDILEVADGIGLSGANDLDDYVLTKITSKTHLKRKKLAIHAGEKDRSDIKEALALSPDLLIHMTHANDLDLKKAADLQIPVSVCVRSNLTTGVGLPPVLKMLKSGISVSIGTDNMMLNSPDMFEEMHFISRLYGLSDHHVFKMATSNGAKTLGCGFTGSIDIGKKADLIVLNSKSLNLKNVQDPLAGFVRRACKDDILGIV
ncbi:amidohydrolase family protein [Methanolapillus millepedarum]|uniref:5'-deoxyadenosine deaminase n=1 Tax=Methanolapillus millepedarum TaxID=3028296 RepID=A0AA96VGQ1_9EURY|nr:5'-deoxyadenosine deaminase [Methanosarcinaceae archaeon Ac7]